MSPTEFSLLNYVSDGRTIDTYALSFHWQGVSHKTKSHMCCVGLKHVCRCGVASIVRNICYGRGISVFFPPGNSISLRRSLLSLFMDCLRCEIVALAFTYGLRSGKIVGLYFVKICVILIRKYELNNKEKT